MVGVLTIVFIRILLNILPYLINKAAAPIYGLNYLVLKIAPLCVIVGPLGQNQDLNLDALFRDRNFKTPKMSKFQRNDNI